MFLFSEPSGEGISRLLDAQRGAPFSYDDVGSSREGVEELVGYTVDHNRARLGEGEETFARAVEALLAWKMFDLFVGAIQAFIFALLTILYFSQSMELDEEHH